MELQVDANNLLLALDMAAAAKEAQEKRVGFIAPSATLAAWKELAKQIRTSEVSSITIVYEGDSR